MRIAGSVEPTDHGRSDGVFAKVCIVVYTETSSYTSQPVALVLPQRYPASSHQTRKASMSEGFRTTRADPNGLDKGRRGFFSAFAPRQLRFRLSLPRASNAPLSLPFWMFNQQLRSPGPGCFSMCITNCSGDARPPRRSCEPTGRAAGKTGTASAKMVLGEKDSFLCIQRSVDCSRVSRIQRVS